MSTRVVKFFFIVFFYYCKVISTTWEDSPDLPLSWDSLEILHLKSSCWTSRQSNLCPRCCTLNLCRHQSYDCYIGECFIWHSSPCVLQILLGWSLSSLSEYQWFKKQYTIFKMIQKMKEVITKCWINRVGVKLTCVFILI